MCRNHCQQLDFSGAIKYYFILRNHNHMLTGKEKRSLRSAANQLKPSVMIGKEGVTPRLMEFLEEAFNRRELVKLRVLDSCPEEIETIADQVCKLDNSELVQILGRTLLLYRPHPEPAGTSTDDA
jgi:RNA-binding protein